MVISPIYIGICGTDIHLVTANRYTHYVQSSAPAHIPPAGRIIGHEGVGRVVSVGDGVRHIRPEQIVGFESILACGQCDTCRRGRPNQCRTARLLGLEFDGLFAEAAVVPARLCRPIGQLADSDEGLRAASLLEPASVAYLACLNSRIAPGDRVLVFGGGPIGILVAVVARQLFGACQVHLVEPIPFRRQIASQVVDQVFSVEDFFGSSGSHDVLVDASGALDSVSAALPRVDAGGRVCLLARGGTPFHVEAVDHLLTNNISILGSRGHLGGCFERLIELLLQRRLDLGFMITETINGLHALKVALDNPEHLVRQNCKILCRL